MFINKYALLNAHSEEEVAENTLLFTIEYLFLCREACKSNGLLFTNVLNYIRNCRVKPGLFNQHPIPMSGKEAYMSHDQLTAIVAFSHAYDMDMHLDIWEWLVNHWFTYNNISGETDFRRLLHPRDIIYYGYCAGNRICKLLYPLLFVTMCITCLQKYKVRDGVKILKTDGKLLAWLRCKASKFNKTYKVLEFILKRNKEFGSFLQCFKIYFRYPEHPIRKLLGV